MEEKDTNQVISFMILKTASVYEVTKERSDLIRENRQICTVKRMFMPRAEDECTFSRWRRAVQAVGTVHAKAELMVHPRN